MTALDIMAEVDVEVVLGKMTVYYGTMHGT